LTTSQALGHHVHNGVQGSGRMTVLWAQGWRGSAASQAWERRGVHSVTVLGRTTFSWAQEQHRKLGDGITGSGQGRWRRVKGLDRGQERRRGGSEEDSTMAWRLRGGLNDGTSSGEVDNSTGSREILAASGD
jgi:hypothetical protein